MTNIPQKGNINWAFDEVRDNMVNMDGTIPICVGTNLKYPTCWYVKDVDCNLEMFGFRANHLQTHNSKRWLIFCLLEMRNDNKEMLSSRYGLCDIYTGDDVWNDDMAFNHQSGCKKVNVALGKCNATERLEIFSHIAAKVKRPKGSICLQYNRSSPLRPISVQELTGR